MYGLVVVLQVLGAFAFVLAHGGSMLFSFRFRTERDPVRQVLAEPDAVELLPAPWPAARRVCHTVRPALNLSRTAS